MSAVDSVDLSQLAAYAGTYQQALFSILYNNLDVVKDVMFWPGVKNTVNMTKLSVGKGAKPYTGVFAPETNDLEYTGLQLTVQPWQRDLTIQPSLYRNSWMGEARGKGEGASNLNIPFQNYVWSTVFKALAAGINDNSVYFGVGTSAYTAFNSGTAYSVGNRVTFTKANGELGYFICTGATSAGETPLTNPSLWADDSLKALFVGFGAVISALITLGGADGLTPFVTGAITSSSNAYQLQKELWRSLPVAVQNYGGVIYQSYIDYQLLTDSFETSVSKYTELDVTTGLTYLAGTNRKCIIKPVTWMTGSRRLIATTTDNMIFATDELSDYNDLNIERRVYTLDCGISGVAGVQIKDPTKMVVSDQL
jgi:hypothetical protein